MKKALSFRRFAALALVSTFALAACDDDGTEPHDDHNDEASGVQILVSGNVVATYTSDNSTWVGAITVDAGSELDITVQFTSDDGDVLTPDDDEYLDVVIADETVADFHGNSDGAFAGHVDGLAAGETTAVFRLMHGQVGSGHPDFVSTGVRVTVGPS